MSDPKRVMLFNTDTRSKEQFRAIQPGQAKLYTCGPTVYHYAHIGNMRTYVFEDLLVRTLRHAGFEVLHVMNITDVGHLVSDADEGDDKMEKGSTREGKSAWEIAIFYTNAFFSDFEKLNCLAPQIICKATDYINEMIELVQQLEKKGFIYRTSDGIYFDTSLFPRYKNFARLDVENLDGGNRVALGEKKHLTDFALWKFSPAGTKRQMEWESPWGKGFPGWHIECSAMSMKHLGKTFDLHCGGKDHIPIHHTNEIAQSEAATGVKFANYWLHGEFLIEETGKMSKSAGEFLTLSVLEKQGFRPADYRFLLLQAHYRTEIRFSLESLSAAREGLNGILNRMTDWYSSEIDLSNYKMSDLFKNYQTRFDTAIYDDLNSPLALAVLFDVVKDAHLLPGEKMALVRSFDSVLGIDFEKEYATRKKVVLTESVQDLVRQRDIARANKNWSESDRIRNLLVEEGFRVEDTANGTRITPV